MTGKGQAAIEHTKRTDRFKYEEDVKNLDAALEKARTRSMGTQKRVYVMRNIKDDTFVIHTHGVEMKDQKREAVYQKGHRIV